MSKNQTPQQNDDEQLSANEQQILEDIRGDPVSADVIPRPYVDEEESA